MRDELNIPKKCKDGDFPDCEYSHDRDAIEFVKDASHTLDCLSPLEVKEMLRIVDSLQDDGEAAKEISRFPSLGSHTPMFLRRLVYLLRSRKR